MLINLVFSFEECNNYLFSHSLIRDIAKYDSGTFTFKFLIGNGLTRGVVHSKPNGSAPPLLDLIAAARSFGS